MELWVKLLLAFVAFKFITQNDAKSSIRQATIRNEMKYMDNPSIPSVRSVLERGGVVAFVANWCGHCNNLKKSGVMEKLAKSVHNPVTMIELGESPEIAKKFGVKGYPSIRKYDGGDLVKEHRGKRDVESLIAFAN